MGAIVSSLTCLTVRLDDKMQSMQSHRLKAIIMTQLSVSEAQPRFPELLTAARAGEVVEILSARAPSLRLALESRTALSRFPQNR